MTADAGLAIKIKSEQEVARTFRECRLSDRGFLSNSYTLAMVTAALGLAPIYWPWSAVLIALLVMDYATFVLRRVCLLRKYGVGAPRLKTLSDFAQVSELYKRAGTPEPSMSSWSRAAGHAEAPQWREDQRYRIASSHYTGGTLVDVGCGDGRLCWRYKVCPPESYVGVEITKSLLQILLAKTQNMARAVEAVAEDLKLPDESADIVICSECFEHLPAPAAALQEFNRIIKPGGKIVIQSPNALRLRNINPLHIVTLIAGYWFPAILLRKVVHENTFVTAFTYHWDFTRQDFEGYVRECPGLQLSSIRGSTYRFNPDGSCLHRLLSRVFRLPVIHWLGWDLTVVLRKAA